MASLPLFDLGAQNAEPWMPTPPPPAISIPVGPRWFIRCKDCLTVAVVTETPNTYDWQCDACNGPLESMGRVERDRLVHEHHASPCDDRCTHARGPHCDCSCGGANHGTKRVVRVIRDAGAVPRVKMPQPMQAQRIALEYRNARAAALATLDPLLDAKRRREFLPPFEYRRMRELQAALRAAHEARDHKTRLRKLTAAIGAK